MFTTNPKTHTKDGTHTKKQHYTANHIFTKKAHNKRTHRNKQNQHTYTNNGKNLEKQTKQDKHIDRRRTARQITPPRYFQIAHTKHTTEKRAQNRIHTI